MIFHVVMHVTLLLIVAYFLLFSASKAEGLVKLLGTILGVWLMVVAAFVIIGWVTMPMFGGRPFGMDMHAMHGNGNWMHRDWQQPAPATTPAKPGG